MIATCIVCHEPIFEDELYTASNGKGPLGIHKECPLTESQQMTPSTARKRLENLILS
jgi:hypothetical protein